MLSYGDQHSCPNILLLLCVISYIYKVIMPFFADGDIVVKDRPVKFRKLIEITLP